MEDRHIASAARILKSVHYLTLATVCEDGAPWNSPLSASLDGEVSFKWGSSRESVHSQNVRRDGRAFAVVYDSTAPEGTGEGVYMLGKAWELDEQSGALRIYRFVPEHIWINDEAKNEDGSYMHDIRVEIDIHRLKSAL
jgi:hypothetical protein